jgi:hypothetical protein
VTGLTETIANGMDLTLPFQALISVAITVVISVSQSDPGHVKGMSVRLRRTNTSGTILRTDTVGDQGDSSNGNQTSFSYSYTDNSPSDGHYVVTVQETGGTSATQIYSLNRTLTLIGG